jgi:EmrB/QacA subfamily drug resistance transporter
MGLRRRTFFVSTHALTSRRRTVATLGVLGGAFLAAIEATIVSTAMPTVVEHLGGLAHYSWVFSAYILTSTVTMPLWGRLSDLYGRRPFYLTAVGIFLVGSALSGAAQSMTELVIYRAIQGIGAGGLLPLGMTIIGELYTLEERSRAQGYFSGVWGIASIVGPLIGGFITQTISWRWVFYLNVPFGILAAVLVAWSLERRESHRDHVIDYAGALVMASAVTLWLAALSQTGARHAVVPTPMVVALYAASIVMAILFVRIERRVVEPVLPLDLLADRFVGTATLTGFLTGVAMFGAISFVPLFVQAAMERSATQAGSALTPLLLGWVLMAVVTSRVVTRVGFRRMVVIGVGVLVLGFAGLLFVSRTTGLPVLYVVLGLMGMGMGMTMLTLLLVQQNAVPVERLGIATSLGMFSRSIGGAVGVALMGAVMTASLGGASQPPDAPTMERALHQAFVCGALVAVAAWVSSLRLPQGVPSHMAARRARSGTADPRPDPEPAA